MKKNFDEVSLKCSEITTKHYSTSFSLGIRLLDKKIHSPIYSIYGFVRLADEIVDSFHEFDKAKLLNEFKENTKQAIENKISLNPILNSFQEVVNKYNIEWEHIQDFLSSMESDLNQKKHDEDSYKQYIKGSAEAVGLMCLRVFCNNNNKLYNDLEKYAIYLGSVFQKVNFIRDISSDYNELKRVYFPQLNINEFNEEEKNKIEDDIEKEFSLALIGIKQLPKSAKKGVFLAYSYYYSLFKKIKSTPANKIMTKRIRIPNFTKLLILIKVQLLNMFKLI
ncbi:MAG: squalene/phytoene synthase family protein [Flavobacteriales bacterium]|nr:squalene/phytoene synthase family protein [Flavobacteriales bacterium]